MAAERVIAKPVRNSRKIARKGKGSQTPGKSKGEWCMSRGPKKYFAINPKARNDPHYREWHDKFKKQNMGSKA